MIGSAIIIRPERSIEFRTYTGHVDEDHWSEIIGGLVEVIPQFDHWIDAAGVMRPCIAFCNEEGHILGLPINHYATAAWQYLLTSKKQKYDPNRTTITGPVVIVFGDDDFMESI